MQSITNNSILILGQISTTIGHTKPLYIASYYIRFLNLLQSDQIKVKSTFRTKDFCYFWNTLTTLQQNHAENFNNTGKCRALFLKL